MTSERLKVSIVMPVYNGGNYFELALQSALAQTYGNTEIIIVNDGSTDGGVTDAIARRYADQHPDKIRYFQQENTGVAGALNTAVRELTGDIFCWLSHDDLYAPEKTTTQVDFWHRLGRADAMLISNYTLIDPEGKQFANVQFDHEQFKRSPKIPLFRGAVNGCTIFIPIGLLRAIPGPFDVSRRFTQDFQLWRQLIQSTDFYHVPQSLVHYRVHPSQDSQRPDIAEEGETLWRAMVDETTEIERVQMYGSSWQFYEETRKILAPTSYVDTVRHLEARRDSCLQDTLVSVIVPFFNEIALVRRALASILKQTYRRLDVVLIDDGSTEAMDDLERDVAADARVRLLHIPNGGPGAARNHALPHCRGDYVAFLDADDFFLPNKIDVQLRAMMIEGAVASHTSYLVIEQGASNSNVLESGRTSGTIYPGILSNCPIATPTVMLSRLVIQEGFAFANTALTEDVAAWVDLSARHKVLGLNEALTVVEQDANTASGSVSKGMKGLENLLHRFRDHPVHARHSAELDELQFALTYLQSLQTAGTNRIVLERAPEPLRVHHQTILLRYHEQLAPIDADAATEMLYWANTLHQTVDTLVPLAVSCLGAGEHTRALALLDQAAAIAGPEIPVPVLHVRAITKCHLGHFDQALADMQSAWEMQPTNDSLSYGLASLLAFQKQFHESERLFATPLDVPIGNGGKTSTNIITFDPPNPDHRNRVDRLYRRSINLSELELSKIHAECDVVFCFCCDMKYFRLFAAAVYSSIRKNSGVRAGLHLHIVNPDEQTINEISGFKFYASTPVSISKELVDLSSLNDNQRKTYYSCVRFLILPELLSSIRCPVLLTDADQMIVQSVEPLLNEMHGFDAGLLLFPHAAYNILSLVSASVVFARPELKAISFFERIADYLALKLCNKIQMQWHLDQAALAVAYLANQSVAVRALDPRIMHSNVYDGTEATLANSIFWSITYSIPENVGKMDTLLYKNFHEADGHVD